MNFLLTLWTQVEAISPLFILILLGYCLVKIGRWQKTVTDSLTRFVFVIAIPVMLFRIMSRFSELPDVNFMLLFAFFGASFLVFILGRIIARLFFKMDGKDGTMFAMGGIYTNCVFVGIPIAKVLLGDSSIPAIALVVVFNALLLWTLATVSIEFSVMGKFSLNGFYKTVKTLFKNPVILGIFSGLAWNYSTLPMPAVLDQVTGMLSEVTTPMCLLVLGMGLTEYKIRDGWRISCTICFLKLLVLPLAIYILAKLLGLSELETNVVVLLGSISIAINCYIMARQFNVLQAPIASSLILSNVFSALTTPLILAIITHL